MFSPSRFSSAAASRAQRAAGERRRRPRLTVAAVAAAMGLTVAAAIALTVPRASAYVPQEDGGATTGERTLRQPAQDGVPPAQAALTEQDEAIGGRPAQREAGELAQPPAPGSQSMDQPTSPGRQEEIDLPRAGLQPGEAPEQEGGQGRKAERLLELTQGQEAASPLPGGQRGVHSPAALVAGDGDGSVGKSSARRRDGLGAVALDQPTALGLASTALGTADGSGGPSGTPHGLALSPEARALLQGSGGGPGGTSVALKGVTVLTGWAAVSGCPPFNGPGGTVLCGLVAAGTASVVVQMDKERIQLAQQQDGTEFGPHRAAMVERIWAEWLAGAVLGGIGRALGPFWFVTLSLGGPAIGNALAYLIGPDNRRLRELTAPVPGQ